MMLLADVDAAAAAAAAYMQHNQRHGDDDIEHFVESDYHNRREERRYKEEPKYEHKKPEEYNSRYGDKVGVHPLVMVHAPASGTGRCQQCKSEAPQCFTGVCEP
jgi:hypothetical protein